MDRAAYKAEHELFVAGSAGTSTAEVVQVALVIPIAVLLHRSVHYALCSAGVSLYPHAHPDSSQVHAHAGELSFASTLLVVLFEFSLLVVPTIAACTTRQWRTHMYVAMLALAFLCHGFVLMKRKPSAKAPRSRPFPSSWLAVLQGKHVHCISLYRAYMMVLTCVCILAVDFRVFPRAFAKTETFGQSVMDVGVGCFVFASALVSKQAQASTRGDSQSYARVIKRTLLKVSPLLVLGFIRLIGTKSTDYQEHVSEYGVHWNFFFTLAGISLIVSLLNPPPNHAIATGVGVAACYQLALWLGLQDYILNAPRTNLLAMNKEGVFSCFGYVAIFLCGLQLGTILLPRGSDAARKMKDSLLVMGGTDAVCWLLTLLSGMYIAENSRRMANLTYVLFTVSYNVLVLFLLLAMDMFFEPAPQLILFSINRNSLVLFLVANLMTGGINLSMHTIYASDVLAYAIIGAYMLAFSTLAVILHKADLTLRFW